MSLLNVVNTFKRNKSCQKITAAHFYLKEPLSAMPVSAFVSNFCSDQARTQEW